MSTLFIIPNGMTQEIEQWCQDNNIEFIESSPHVITIDNIIRPIYVVHDKDATLFKLKWSHILKELNAKPNKPQECVSYTLEVDLDTMLTWINGNNLDIIIEAVQYIPGSNIDVIRCRICNNKELALFKAKWNC